MSAGDLHFWCGTPAGEERSADKPSTHEITLLLDATLSCSSVNTTQIVHPSNTPPLSDTLTFINQYNTSHPPIKQHSSL